MWFSKADGWERQRCGSMGKKFSNHSGYFTHNKLTMAIGCQIIRLHLEYSPQRDISIMGWVCKQLCGKKNLPYVCTHRHIQAHAHTCIYSICYLFSNKAEVRILFCQSAR